MITLTGWMGKDSYQTFLKHPELQFMQYRIPTMVRNKGNEIDWPEFEWPPVYVTALFYDRTEDVHDLIDAAVAEERERCARICDKHEQDARERLRDNGKAVTAYLCAAEIRSPSQ